ncbi:glucosaminidase domain-containing protein [Flavobacterium sp. U410]
MVFKRIGMFSLLLLLFACGSTNKVRVTTTKAEQEAKDKALAASQTKSNTTAETKTASGESLEATSKVNTTSTTVNDYILQFKDVAKGNMKTYGIPASITLAQGILESGAGKGRLCLEANNHFGIKCHTGWTGPSITHDDDAAQECFRKYNDPAESYKDHSLFLTSRSRYASLFTLDKLDYQSWANGLKTAGYATDPKYPSKLISLIERYQLYLYDQEVMSPSGEVFASNTKEEMKTEKEVQSTSSIQVVETTPSKTVGSSSSIQIVETMPSSNVKTVVSKDIEESSSIQVVETIPSKTTSSGSSIQIVETMPSSNVKTVIAKDSTEEIVEQAVETVEEIVETVEPIKQQVDEFGMSNKVEVTEAKVVETQTTETSVTATLAANEYMVQKGDTLYSLSKKFNTTVEALQAKNNLGDSAIKIGQILKVK